MAAATAGSMPAIIDGSAAVAAHACASVSVSVTSPVAAEIILLVNPTRAVLATADGDGGGLNV
jgi:hypothetical protein